MGRPKCILCREKAVTTAAQIPVCEEHWIRYAAEAKADGERPFYTMLVNADATERRKE